jgi:predicted nucleotidyltransferase
MNTDDSRLLPLTEVEQRALREFVTQLQERLDGGLLSVTLFGSRARGTGGPDSDLDVLVVVEQDDLAVCRAIRYLAADVWLAHGHFISTRIWSREKMERMEREPTLLARNIQREGINLLPASRDREPLQRLGDLLAMREAEAEYRAGDGRPFSEIVAELKAEEDDVSG